MLVTANASLFLHNSSIYEHWTIKEKQNAIKVSKVDIWGKNSGYLKFFFLPLGSFRMI